MVKRDKLAQEGSELTRITSKNTTSINELADPPTEEEMLEFGRYALNLLHDRGFAYRGGYRQYTNMIMENTFVDLPRDTVEHRMETIWELHHITSGIKIAKEKIDHDYDELVAAAREMAPSKAI